MTDLEQYKLKALEAKVTMGVTLTLAEERQLSYLRSLKAAKKSGSAKAVEGPAENKAVQSPGANKARPRKR